MKSNRNLNSFGSQIKLQQKYCILYSMYLVVFTLPLILPGFSTDGRISKTDVFSQYSYSRPTTRCRGFTGKLKFKNHLTYLVSRRGRDPQWKSNCWVSYMTIIQLNSLRNTMTASLDLPPKIVARLPREMRDPSWEMAHTRNSSNSLWRSRSQSLAPHFV